jgi:hypothetical protein
MFVALLADSPDDLAKCEIIVREPESKKRRPYGRDGRMLFNTRFGGRKMLR